MSEPLDSDMSTAEKLQLLMELKAYSRATKENGLSMYRPHHKQDLFHRMGGIKYRYLRTGNRFGKSDCGTAEDVAWCVGERLWYPEGDSARTVGIPKKAVKGLILCTDWGKAEEVFTNLAEGPSQGKLWKWLPKAYFVRKDVNHSGEIHKLTIRSIHGGESTLYIDTVAGFKVNDQRAESNWYDFIHVDEPIPKPMWDGYSRGLIDTNGSAWFTCTPLREPWINRFFLPSNRTLLDPHEANIFSDTKGKVNRVVIIGASTDNPFVSAEAIESYMEGLDERQKAARLFGRPIDQSGAVHSSFCEEHVYFDPPEGWSDMARPPKDYTLRYHIDCHPATENAVLFCATAPSGQVFFFYEIWDKCDAESLAQQIVEVTKDYFCPVELMDPSGFIQTMRDKSCFADDLVGYGIMPEKGSKDLLRGIKLANQMLDQRMPNGDRRLKFSNELVRTLFEFDNYVYDDPTKRPDRPKDKDDHMMEGFRRLCVSGLDYISADVFDEPSSAPAPLSLLAL